jgi:hypothetical protein
MAWFPVGAIATNETFRTVGVASSSLLRVSYSSLTVTSYSLGFLRQKWDAETTDSNWVKLYPKQGVKETFELIIPVAFQDSGLFEREIQVRGSKNTNWVATVEQWF